VDILLNDGSGQFVRRTHGSGRAINLVSADFNETFGACTWAAPSRQRPHWLATTCMSATTAVAFTPCRPTTAGFVIRRTLALNRRLPLLPAGCCTLESRRAGSGRSSPATVRRGSARLCPVRLPVSPGPISSCSRRPP